MNALRPFRWFFARWVAFTLLALSAACTALVQTPAPNPAPSESTPTRPAIQAIPTVTPTPTRTVTRTVTRTMPPYPTLTQDISPTPTLEQITVLTSFDQLPARPFDLQYKVGHLVYRLGKDSQTPELFRDLSVWQEGDFFHMEWRGNRLFRSNGYREGGTAPGVVVEWQVIDLETNTIRPVIQFYDPEKQQGFSPDISFSPDGRWAVYCSARLSTDSTRDELVLFSVDDPGKTRVLASCNWDRFYINWSPGSNQLVWKYNEAIWTAPVNGSALRILPGELYRPPYEDDWEAWSSSNRYVIINADGTIEGGMKAILDLSTGKEDGVPNTWQYTNAAAWIGWIQNDRLLSLKPSGMAITPEGVIDPFEITIWKINPGAGDLLEPEAVYKIDGFDPFFWPFNGRVTEDGRILFAMLPPEADPDQKDEDWQGGIYQYDPRQSSLQRVQPLPKNLAWENINTHRQFLWAPDSSAALIGPYSELYYLPLDGEHFYEIQAVFGPRAFSFTWLP